MRARYLQVIGIFLFSGMIVSCGSDAKQPTEQPVAEVEEELTDEDLSHAEDMIQQMPSPIEMAILVKHAGGEYNSALLNDVKNISDYVTNGKKTINLGIYSSDVGYTSLYKQTQETVFYLNNVRKLSDAIGLSDAFDQALFDRVEANIENRDSLLYILSGANDAANEYLKNNNRMNTSILMMAGGWIESMYLAANLGEGGGRPEDIISLRILEQEVVLDKIIKTMKMVGDDPLVAEFADKLEELDRVLVAKDIKVGEGDDATVDQEKMAEVYDLIDGIRAWAVA
ncbi:MAG: hypothetical protein JKX84_09505 [Flavobacteriales bacterium]|nr:hypothetical protein [Flavobacteriales bacterium]